MCICQAKIAPMHICLDPGHGGEDKGATARKHQEKTVTLAIARYLDQELKLRGYQTSMTRSTDTHKELWERTAFANAIKADLFISIHANIAAQSHAAGIETYVLRHNSLEINQKLGAKPLVVAKEPEDIHHILQDVRLDGTAHASHLCACALQHHLSHSAQKNRGVKTGLFHVLLDTHMPSVLVETGFLSNTQDAHYLLAAKSQKEIAIAMANAIDDYSQGIPHTCSLQE